MAIPRLQRVNRGATPDATAYNRALSEIERAHRVRGILPIQVQFDATGFTLALDTTTVLDWPLPDGDTLGDYIDAAGSGITVEEEDGSPSYTDTTTLIVDQSAGLVLSQPGAGNVLISIEAATASQWGVVSDTTQAFGGVKTFQDGARTDTYFIAPFMDLTATSLYGTESDGQFSFVGDAALTAEAGKLYWGRPTLASPARTEAVIFVRVDSGADECTTFHIVSNDPGVQTSRAVLFGAGTGVPYFVIRHNTTEYTGVNADDMGLKVAGGITYGWTSAHLLNFSAAYG